MSEIDAAPLDAAPVDPVSAPAVRLACLRCGVPTLLRPGGFCPACIAAVGLAVDRAGYVAWRRVVEAEVQAAMRR